MTTDAAEGSHYFAADAEADDELARLKLLEALCDPWTFRCLDGIAVRQGWRCLEVGAGAGSVVRWLSERVVTLGGSSRPIWIRGFSAICARRTWRCGAATHAR